MKTEERRRALRETLIILAEARIAEDGLAGLRARDLAAAAGCAVGAIYNAAGDLGDIVQAVNDRTVARLGQHVAGAAGAEDPVARLIALGQAYHGFAAAEPRLWRALFEIERKGAAPEAYMAAMDGLFTLIEAPLGRLRPDLGGGDLRLMARALFSAVHGVVALGQDQAAAGVPPGDIDRMIALLLQGFGASARS